MLIRNDDVALDTKLSEIQTFCNICDKHGFKIIQCITPVGKVQFIDSHMDDATIKRLAGDTPFTDNKEVYEYLRSRDDDISIHGLYHTHYPTLDELYTAKQKLMGWGFTPTYNTYPFNELTVAEDAWGLKTLGKSQRLEDYHSGGIPTDEVVYLHSWRYTSWYTHEVLDKMLERLANATR